MGVERVGLEHHRQSTPRRTDMGGVLSIDFDRAFGDVFQSGDQPQERRLAATGGSDKYHELPIVDGQIERRDDLGLPKALRDVLKIDASHDVPLT